MVEPFTGHFPYHTDGKKLKTSWSLQMKLTNHVPRPKQYVIYDFNSFVADWGGYMGLVLGFRD